MSSTSAKNPLDEKPKLTLDLFEKLHALIEDFKESRPNDRSVQDRFWAITITHLENAESTFWSRIFAVDSTKKIEE